MRLLAWYLYFIHSIRLECSRLFAWFPELNAVSEIYLNEATHHVNKLKNIVQMNE